ncbi:MAG: hypothetical protein AABW45_02550 [Nanoarchaeota archaeon]
MVAIKKQINLIIAISLLFFVVSVNAQYILSLDAEVTEPDKTFYPGQEVMVSTDVRSLGETRDRVDIKLNYKIIDYDNNLITQRESTFAVHTSLKTTETFKLPEDLKPGKYNVIVKVSYGNYDSSASDLFYIESKFLGKSKEFIKENPFIFTYGVLILIIIVAAFLYYSIHRRNDKENI